MEFIGDYHIHSHYSDGRQSIDDIIEAARRKGLKEIAVTDHGPMAAVIGVSRPEDYLEIKEKLRAWQESCPDIRLLVGAEANIRDLKGTLDIPPAIVEELDLLIAGLHPYTRPGSWRDGRKIFVQNSLRRLGGHQRRKARENNTKATVEAIYNNPGLDIIAHPGLFFAVDVDEVARACVKNDVLFEINCGHEHPPLSDIIKAERSGVDFIINSDAHFPESVGKLEYGARALEALGIDQERVVNRERGGGLKAWGKKDKICIYS